MKNWLKQNKETILWILGGLVLVIGIYIYNNVYVPYEHLQKGFVIVNGFDCPIDHPIKAHLGSMIYHEPGDPYYRRTSASNGYCFDIARNAVAQGFRAIYNK